jgi:hypothetical protein
VHPVSDRVFGPTLVLSVLVRCLACSQLLDGLPLLSSQADTRGSRILGGLGQLERALSVIGRPLCSSRNCGGQALPIAFTKERVGDDRRSSRGRALFRRLFQHMARLLGRGIQTLLFLLGTQACRYRFGLGLLGLLLCGAAQIQQDG